jgi:hypothetical protein
MGSCAKCQTEILENKDETCWYCGKSICLDCWELYGQCGHLEAKQQIQELVARALLGKDS